MKDMVFLDYNATTPLCEEARNIIVELASWPLNPSSVHSFGRKGKSFLDKARKQIALLLGIQDELQEYNITFTSSGTEANNLILHNYADGELFISAIEHASVLMPAMILPNSFLLPVDDKGIVRLDIFEKLLSETQAEKKLVSIMLANNETGIIQPIKDIVKISHKYGAHVHSDIVQAVGKMPVDISNLGVDFATISGHKFGGATGCGALISRKKYHLQPMLYGGGQEKSLRSGTENLLAISATGEAAYKCYNNLENRILDFSKKRDYFESELKKRISGVQIVGEYSDRIPNTSGIIIPSKTAALMVIALDLKGFAIGSGSACSSGKVSKSKVLEAMGYDEKLINSALRISFGEQNTKKEIDDFILALEEI